MKISDRMKKLQQMCASLAAERNQEALLFSILDAAMDLSSCDAGTLYLLEEDGLHFCRMITRSMGVRQGGEEAPITLPPVPLKPSHVCARAVLESSLINVPDVKNDSRFDFSGAARYDAMTGYDTRSMLVFPLRDDRDRIVGVLQLINALTEDGQITSFPKEMEPLVKALASQAAISLTNMKQPRHGHRLIWAVLALLVSLIVIYYNADVFASGIFSTSVALADPLNYYQSGDTSYIVNGSGLEVVVLKDGEYRFSLSGGRVDDGFYYARDVKTDSAGNIYVLDKLVNENGKDTDAERIVVYDHRGSFREILYSYEHAPGSSILQLYNLTVTDRAVSFVCTSPEGTFAVHELPFDPAESAREQTYSYENVYEAAWDFAFDGQGGVYISSKSGVIEKIDGESGERTVLYAAPEQYEDYFSIPTSIEYASDGSIYFNDIGHRKVQKLLPDGSIRTAVDIAEPIDQPPEAFCDKPIYAGLYVGEALDVATFYAHSYFVEMESGEGEQIYEYKLLLKSDDGQHLINGSSFEKASSLVIRGIVVAVLAAVAAAISLVLLAVAARRLLKASISGTVKTQLIIVFTAVIATCLSLYIIVSETNKVYYDEIMHNLENLAYFLSHSVEEEDLAAVNTPGDFMSESYRDISDSVLEVLDNSVNSQRGVYCVIYKAQNNIVSAVYSDTAIYGSGYPMPGSFEGSAEQQLYETGEVLTLASHSSSEGNFMLVLTPVFGEDGDVIGLMEIGTDLYVINENTRRQMVNTVLLVMTAIMVGVLLVSELIVIWANMKKRALTRDRVGSLDSGMIRPVVFLFCFISNMPTAFLPIFARSLWTPDFPAPVEVATALPVSTELLITAIVSLAFGFVVPKFGVKLLTISGAVLFAAGNLLCALAPNLAVLVGGSAVTGIGDGLVILALNSYIAGYEDDEQKNNGFIHYNAALLSGVNCGTVIGSAIAESFGYSATYLVATGICLLLVMFCFPCIRNHSHTAVAEKSGVKVSSLQFILKPNVIRYFLLISAPYLICAAFLNYFFPIFGEENSLTPTQISLAFLLMGIVSIYFGPGLTKVLSQRLGAKKSMLLATMLYGLGLVLFIVRPRISTCYLSVVLFAFADSFGTTAQSVYYTTLPDTIAIGEGPAMGINSGVSNAASTAGPLIFGAALMMGTVAGITVITIGFALLAALFVITSFRPGRDPSAPVQRAADGQNM